MPSISAVTCVVGDSGSGKSVLVATFAKWVWAKHRAPTRLYHFDPGGWNDELQELIRAGIVEVWKVYTRDILGESTLVTETLMRASQGWWPAEIDPETGNVPHAAKLVPPAPDWRGAVAYDGISSMCAWAENEMGVRAAAGTLGGEGSNMKPIFSGEMKSGSGNRASIGFIQNEARKWVLAMLSQKGLVAPPVVTSLEAKVTDSETKLMLYGPKLSGQAKTPDSLAWLGNTLGAWMDGGEHRLYLRDYKWPAGDMAPHKCKVRAKPAVVAQLPEYLTDGVNNASLTKFNLGYFFDLLDELSAKEAEKGKALLEGAPGMKASTIQAAPAAGTGTPAAAATPAPAAPAKPGAMKLQPRPAAAPPAVPAPAQAAAAGNAQVAPPVPAPAAPPAAAPAPPTAPPSQPQAAQAPKPAAPAPAAPLRPAPAGMKPLARAPVPAAPAQKQDKK